jgi:16S rRNA G966 N2-methylase RsmD
MDEAYTLHLGDNIEVMKKMDDKSIDSVVCDPPYAGVKRDYGYWEDDEWHLMMSEVVTQIRRVLKPKGSAMFVLQSNQSTIGTMRPWLWQFLAKYTKEWNMIQDAYWWNYAYMPTTHVSRKHRLMRPSLKVCAWFGAPDAYRNQDAILWKPSDANKAHNLSDRALKKYPSGSSMREGRCIETMNARGGSTPFNVIPLSEQESIDNVMMCTGGKKAGSTHGATTPLQLCEYWVNYITPAGGTVLDPFSGTGTVGRAAIRHGFKYVGIERYEEYHKEAQKGLSEDAEKMESIL